MVSKLLSRVKKQVSPKLAIYALIFLGAVGLYAQLVAGIHREEGIWYDQWFLTFFGQNQHPLISGFFQVVTFAGSSILLTPAAVGLAVYLYQKRLFDGLFLVVLGYGGACALNIMSKIFYARARPDLFPHLTEVYVMDSFPSGHTAQATAFAMTLTLICREAKPERAGLVAWIALTTAFLVGISRIYLQVHYPSDVLAGYITGGLWVWGAHQFIRWRQSRRKRITEALNHE